MNLCQYYKGSGRNITTDNFFTSLPLVMCLREQGLTLVGTLRKNKPYIPKEFLPSKNREVTSTLFGFRDEGTLCSYVPKKNKAVVLLSSMHTTAEIDDTAKAKKPEIILYYNSTKAGVDQMDQMLTQYTTKRRTNRWPLAFFYNILDIACLAAHIIYSENNPQIACKTDRRRLFLKNLARDLCISSIIQRSKESLVTRFYFVRTAMENILGVKIATVHNPPPTPAPVQERDKTGRLKFTGYCIMCNTADEKRKRRTRKRCYKCKNPVCDEHTNPAPTVCRKCVE